MLGTIIPQNGNHDIYLNASTFSFFDLTDIYHSWWFRLALILLAINVLVCTAKQLPKDWTIIFDNKKKNPVKKIKKFSQMFKFSTDKKASIVSDLCRSVLKGKYRNVSESRKGNFTIIKADSGRWAKLGAHVVHLSVILLLIGGLIGSVFGFEGYVNIVEGETTNSIRLKKTNKVHTLDFDICCDDFEVNFYTDGTPKEYISNLILMKEGARLYEKRILVNDPIRFNGINIFQSSYGKIPSSVEKDFTLPEEIEIVLKDKISGIVFVKKIKLGEQVTLPNNLGIFCILEFLPDANFSGINIGPSFICSHYSVDGNFSEKVLLSVKFPNFDMMRKNHLFISISDQTREQMSPDNDKYYSYYTGLQVTKDPGKILVYAGFFFIILGFIITFFKSYKQLYIEIRSKDNGSDVLMTGHASRNKAAIDSIFREIHNFVEISSLPS